MGGNEIKEKEVTYDDIYAESETVELIRDKKAHIGLFTMRVMRWIRSEYGSIAGFQKEVLEKLSDKDEEAVFKLLGVIYQLLDNRDDFTDQDDFENHIKVGQSAILGNAVGKQLAKSMPDVAENTQGETPEKKNDGTS